ncbi:phage virion morphogenesis protein [Testudinibacter sp. TR-2022]|uniref:phage virion morphogenesis protein n=1 Tax=Testudinibacter sp. TR-2022 TaxID=2585029 RepID=UPI00111B8FA2|nr:phage virion morphogenesis protein [Testudinibacter sp. TR-2022]TNH04515.1 phage virion morphogenesis protein [Pasteurellaceae bacterium Phil31]TNH11963.1 phage virion morphogenesis protein [Testudinibacter sp. TR-2022]TNH12732.1 phage virion morphogenesis protein [Testudinibacter sp. TR-2022]TNH13675.1 phage virion morphogenesis protein [Testudinibacter sp. TR-2022]TNH17243.1 phage virion morphogenesis protein [Testudinibacter sp. TR-2022]
MHLEFKFDTSEIQRKFRKLAEMGKSDRLTRKIANVLLEEAEDAFDAERSPEGEKWAVLNPDYKKRRHEKGYTGKILQVSGDLAMSLNIDYGDSFAVIGASEPHGQYHMTGTQHMPARPFLGLGETGIEEIKQILNNALKNAVED